MTSAILLYLMVAIFLAGFWSGVDWAQRTRRTMLDRAINLALCIAWPGLLIALFQLWKEGKL